MVYQLLSVRYDFLLIIKIKPQSHLDPHQRPWDSFSILFKNIFNWSKWEEKWVYRLLKQIAWLVACKTRWRWFCHKNPNYCEVRSEPVGWMCFLILCGKQIKQIKAEPEDCEWEKQASSHDHHYFLRCQPAIIDLNQ